MTHQALKRKQAFNQSRLGFAKVATASLMALLLVACRGHFNDEYKLGLLHVDHNERHPITVDKKPISLSIPVRRGSYGLGHNQNRRVLRFLSKYRSRNNGNSNLYIAVPDGSANEMSAKEAVVDLRRMIAKRGFAFEIRRYRASRHSQPPIRISYTHYVAHLPECANFPTNLASQPDNLQHENFGCSNQHNLAAMVANPADLVQPREMTPRSEERRRHIWEKFVKGESTGAQRTGDEKARTGQ